MQLELAHVIRDPRALVRPKRPEPSYPDLPAVGADQESSIPGVYLTGEVAGTPLIKLGVNQGHGLVDRLAGNLQANPAPEGAHDLVVVGGGASGFGAMMRAKALGLRAVCLEANRFANTVQDMTRGKILFAEPHDVPLQGDVWFEECTREELLERWAQQRQQAGLDIREHEKVTDITRRDGLVEVTTPKGTYRARKVILAIGKAGNPRKAGVPGEDAHADRISHFLADADAFRQQRVVIYGGGDVACEAALRLCGHNTVVLATIDQDLIYPKRRNREAVLAEAAAGRIELLLDTRLVAVGEDAVALKTPDGEVQRPADHLFEMIGAELPLPFFRKIGLKMEGDWGWGRKLALAACLLAVYALYAVKSSTLVFPFTLEASPPPANLLDYLWHVGGGSPTQQAITGALDSLTASVGFIGHNAWYAMLYTAVVTTFGIQAARRWGKLDAHQYWRYASIIGFQIFFFLLVEGALIRFLGLFGEEYAKHYWRGWGLAQPFPLFYNSFFWWYDGDPSVVKWSFIGAGLLLTFVGIPLFVRYHGLRFCTWICGCGGLAETLGDTWRHLSPKGARSRLWEFQATVILVWAFGSAAAIVLFFQTHGDNAVWESYAYVVDFWLVAVLPIGFYPFFGGKIWCRYWCPLANYMKILSGWYGKLRIVSDDKCITCTQCSKYCQVGVDVMHYAKNQIPFDNTNTSCIHCGICIAVCPVDVLSFDSKGRATLTTDDGASPRAAK